MLKKYKSQNTPIFVVITSFLQNNNTLEKTNDNVVYSFVENTHFEQ